MNTATNVLNELSEGEGSFSALLCTPTTCRVIFSPIFLPGLVSPRAVHTTAYNSRPTLRCNFIPRNFPRRLSIRWGRSRTASAASGRRCRIHSLPKRTTFLYKYIETHAVNRWRVYSPKSNRTFSNLISKMQIEILLEWSKHSNFGYYTADDFFIVFLKRRVYCFMLECLLSAIWKLHFKWRNYGERGSWAFQEGWIAPNVEY